MDPHPTITIDHYTSSSASSTSTSLHSKEGFNRQQPQQHNSPSSKSSSQFVGSSSYTTGTISKQHEHSFEKTGKHKQSKNKAPVRQRSVSPPTSRQLLTATDPHSARRNRRKSVCAVFIAPPSPTPADDDIDLSESSSHSDTITIKGNTNNEGSSSMPDSSNNRRAIDHAQPVHGKHHGHRKHSTTPKQSPNASPRGSKSNLSALSSTLMDKIHQANLCIRRKSSPAISAEQLSTIQISSLRGSLALADALSSTSNSSHTEMTSSSKQRNSRQSGYSGGSPVYMEGNSGVVELRRKDHSNRAYLDNPRRLSSPSSLEKGKKQV